MRNPTRRHIWATSSGRTFCGRQADEHNLHSNLPDCYHCLSSATRHGYCLSEKKD